MNILHSPLVITKIRQETLNQELFTLLFFLFISTTRLGVTLRKKKNNVNSVHSPLVITKIRQKALDQER